MILLKPSAAPTILRPTKIVERNLLVYRRTFIVIFSGFFEPLFYLVSMGWGVGALIGTVSLPDGRPVPYVVFVAPALLATSAMNGALYEAGFNFFYKLRYGKIYDAVISTPMAIHDVASGEVLWALIRGSLYSIGFMVVVVAFGLIDLPIGMLAFPAAMLVGFAFAALGMAATTWVRKWQDFDYIQLVTMPMFLFSATFYPLSVYPPELQAIVQVTPLYRAVHLIRGLTTGALEPSMLIDVAYLVVLGIVGVWLVSRRLERKLLS